MLKRRMTTSILCHGRWPLACAALLLAFPALDAQSRPHRFSLETEAGPAWQSYNNVEIPNDGSATRFSLSDLAGAGPWTAGRIYVTWQLNDRHGLRLLLAPFSLAATGVPSAPITFAGETYAAGSPARATYKFNSYRLTYRYRVRTRDRTTAWVGLTAKIRDARIALEQGATKSRKDDLGFVPLLHLSGERQFGSAWRLRLDADALAGGPGRAEDVAVTLGRDLNERWTVRGGYRLVEGGADVKEVYTFAWLHYAVVSIERHW
jgi:hypothetical protein